MTATNCEKVRRNLLPPWHVNPANHIFLNCCTAHRDTWKALSKPFCMHELKYTLNWLLSLWLTRERERECHPFHRENTGNFAVLDAYGCGNVRIEVWTLFCCTTSLALLMRDILNQLGIHTWNSLLLNVDFFDDCNRQWQILGWG